MTTECKLNIAIVGDSGTGKTSLAARYVNDIFRESVARTVVVDSFQKKVIVGGKKVTLTIWDTGGLPGYKAFVQDYIKKADGVVVVVDVTDRTSFISSITWLRDVRRLNTDSLILIVGNKIDKLCPKQVSSRELRDFGNSEKIPAMEVSARTGDDVEKVFQFLAFSILCKEVRGNNPEENPENAIKNEDSTSSKLSLKDTIKNLTTEPQKSLSGLNMKSVLPDKKKFGMNFRIPFVLKFFIYLCIMILLLYYIYNLLTYTFGPFSWDFIQFVTRVQSVWYHVCKDSEMCDKILSSLKTFSVNLILH